MPRLTDRDRTLICFLALARYLTSKQIARLVFPGRADSTVSERLNLLAQESDPYSPLRRLSYRTYEGKIVVVWALTKLGYQIAEQQLGELKVPRQDVGADFLEHSINCSQLFVHLAQRSSRTEPAPLPTTFRWSNSEGQGYAFSDYDRDLGKSKARAVQPDAIIVVPAKRERLFVEMEMGTHSIVSPNEEKTGATITKLERYEEFICGYADVDRKQTWYAKSFPDGLLPALLILVKTAKRRDNVNAAVGEWNKHRQSRLPLLVLTLADASRELRESIGASPRITVDHALRPSPIAAAKPEPPAPPLLTWEEFQALGQSHRALMEIVHRNHVLHRQLSKAGQQPQFPFEEYPKVSNQAALVLEAIYKRLTLLQKKGS